MGAEGGGSAGWWNGWDGMGDGPKQRIRTGDLKIQDWASRHGNSAVEKARGDLVVQRPTGASLFFF